MPVVSDFNVIQAESVNIGDGRDFDRTFNTGGRYPSEGYLTFNLKGYTSTNWAIQVHVNNFHVGNIYPYQGANRSYWYSQSMVIRSGVLRDGNNAIHFDAAPLNPGLATQTDRLDDFQVKDMVVFFHQRA